MNLYYVITGVSFAGMFVLFLVLSKTLNNIVSHLAKLEFLVTKEYEYKREAGEIRKIFTEAERGEDENAGQP